MGPSAALFAAGIEQQSGLPGSISSVSIDLLLFLRPVCGSSGKGNSDPCPLGRWKLSSLARSLSVPRGFCVAIGGTTNANVAGGSCPNPLPHHFPFVRSLQEREGSKDTVAIITLDNRRGGSRATLIPGNPLPEGFNDGTNHRPLVRHERKNPQIISKEDSRSPFLPPPR